MSTTVIGSIKKASEKKAQATPEEKLKIANDRVLAARQRFSADPRSRKLKALILGEKGIGKSSLITTMVKPVYIHSFDMAGTDVIPQRLIDSGEVIIDNRFEVDDMYNPSAYVLWEREMTEMMNSGMFDHIGTFVLDSLTTFADSALWQIMKKEGRVPAKMTAKNNDATQGMRIQDWGTSLGMFTMLARTLGSLPCNSVMIGHIGKQMDESIGKFVQTIVLPGKASDKVPINVSEVYALMYKEKERMLLTGHYKDLKCSTRMGSEGKLDLWEKPNIKAMMKKAGLPCEDLPLLGEE